MLLLNDIHIGFNRSGGTTLASREALRLWLLNELGHLLDTSTETSLVIIGDLFDGFEVPTRDLLATFNLLNETWLSKRKDVTLIAGNHDNSPRAERVSSFTALGSMLEVAHPGNVFVMDVGEHGRIVDGIYAVAHCANQDLFDAALREAYKAFEAEPFKFLLLHANYENGFAAESDHSLNVSEEFARSFTDAGVTLVFAHEHQARTALGSKVVVMGNQWPTSIADCLGNDTKFAHTINAGVLTKAPTWRRGQDAGGYSEICWDALDGFHGDFVRVTGTATAAQAADVVNAIAAFRRDSDAFVITNAVRVEGVAAIEELPQQFEAAKTFDVMKFVHENLDERERAVVDRLLAKGV